MLPNLGTAGSQVKELLLPKRSNQCFPILEPRVRSPRNCSFPNVGTNPSRSWEHMFPVLGTSVSQTWYITHVSQFPNHGFPVGGTGSRFTCKNYIHFPGLEAMSRNLTWVSCPGTAIQMRLRNQADIERACIKLQKAGEYERICKNV